MMIHAAETQQTINLVQSHAANLQRELTRINEGTPIAAATREILETWQKAQPGNPNISPEDLQAKLVRSALRLGHTEPKLPCPRCDASGRKRKDLECTVKDEILEAISYIIENPYAGPGGRSPVPTPGSKRYAGVKYALCEKVAVGKAVVWQLSAEAIQRNRALARRDKMSKMQKLWWIVDEISKADAYWARLLLDELEEQRVASNGETKLDQGRGEGAMNGSEVPGGSEPADATLFGPGGGSGDQAGGGGRVDSSANNGGTGAAQAHLPDS